MDLTRVVGSRWPDPLVIVSGSNDFIDDLLLPRPEVGADGAAEGMERRHVSKGE